MKKRTTITVVTRQRVIARSLRVRCQQCGAEVPIITPEKGRRGPADIPGAKFMDCSPMEICTRLKKRQTQASSAVIRF
jgi:hypothetical protein